jgi:hypothetical protein
VFLGDDIFEDLRTVFAGKNQITHRIAI